MPSLFAVAKHFFRVTIRGFLYHFFVQQKDQPQRE
jgi:hypothetical protein